MKKENSLLTSIKLILAGNIIVMVGATLGLTGYLITNKDKKVEKIKNEINDLHNEFVKFDNKLIDINNDGIKENIKTYGLENFSQGYVSVSLWDKTGYKEIGKIEAEGYLEICNPSFPIIEKEMEMNDIDINKTGGLFLCSLEKGGTSGREFYKILVVDFDSQKLNWMKFRGKEKIERIGYAGRGEIYENEKYNFRFNFGDAWKNTNYLVEEKENAVSFNLKLKEPTILKNQIEKEYDFLFEIKIISKDEWKKTTSDIYYGVDVYYLGASDDGIYSIWVRNFNESSALFSDLNKSLYSDIEYNILPSFEFIKKSIKIEGDTSNWKIYRNEKYGFEVKYPLQAIQNSRYSLEELFVTTTEECANSDPYLQGEEFKGCQKIAVLVHTIRANFGSSAEAIKIGGLSGEKFYFRIPQNYTIDDVSIYRPIGQINAQVGKGPYWYKINVEYHLSEEDAAEKLFDQILSTFKFIEKDTELFSCGDSTVKDIDNNIYNTVKIGEQCWLKENLKVTKDPEGEKIIRYCYNNDESICKTDGGLYDWNTTMNGLTEEGTQGICPEGWHIPEDGEWHEMENGLAIGDCDAKRSVLDHSEWGCDTAGTKLKAGGLSGFEGIFAGYRHPDSSFAVRGANAIFWSSTENGRNVWYRNLHSERSTIRRDAYGKTGSYSVRCLKN